MSASAPAGSSSVWIRANRFRCPDAERPQIEQAQVAHVAGEVSNEIGESVYCATYRLLRDLLSIAVFLAVIVDLSVRPGPCPDLSPLKPSAPPASRSIGFGLVCGRDSGPNFMLNLVAPAP
jgi:hypothetical protein